MSVVGSQIQWVLADSEDPLERLGPAERPRGEPCCNEKKRDGDWRPSGHSLFSRGSASATLASQQEDSARAKEGMGKVREGIQKQFALYTQWSLSIKRDNAFLLSQNVTLFLLGPLAFRGS